MSNDLLKITDLHVNIESPAGTVHPVRGVSLSLQPGEVLAVVGESGCGKSMLCKSIMGLLPKGGKIMGGSIVLDGVELTSLKERELRSLRGSLFSMILQDPMSALDPTLTIERQIGEAIQVHDPKIGRDALAKRILELMRLVEIDDPEERRKLYPYHFSGGMCQRIVLAMALANRPRILLADEPTTALDVTIQKQVLGILKKVCRELGTSVILVSHDLGVVARAADRVAIMYAGKIVEIGTASEIYHDPRHPYTRSLLKSLPALNLGKGTLPAIPGMPPSLIDPPRGDAFARRNPGALAIDYLEEPPMFQVTESHFAASWTLDPRAKTTVEAGKNTAENDGKDRKAEDNGLAERVQPHEHPHTHPHNHPHTHPDVEPHPHASDHAQVHHHHGGYNHDHPAPSHSHVLQRTERKGELLLDASHITKYFRLGKKHRLTALKDVSLQIRSGEIYGLVGESGSGKSTMAKCVMQILEADDGTIAMPGITDTQGNGKENRKRLRAQKCQMIFQDSSSSLNPKMKVADIITEPLRIQKIKPAHGDYRSEAAYQLSYVGMDASYLDKFPGQLSGGQRQRVAIARALTMDPQLLVADEPIASLDVSIQAQIVNLFRHLRDEHGISILFIAHDLSMVQFLCDYVGVMYHGEIVEEGNCRELFANPKHPYTRSLIDAIPYPDPDREQGSAYRAPLTEVQKGGAFK